MRPLVLLLVLSFPLAAQAQPDEGAAHALPFGPAEHAIELEVAGAKAGAVVVVREAPSWVRFIADEAVPEHEEGIGEAVARLAFRLSETAPVAEPGEVVLEVRDMRGVAVATKSIPLVVEAPREAALGAPRPNPSREGATVPFAVPAESAVRLSVFDVLAREVAVLAEGAVSAGGHEARVGRGLAAGVYVVRLVAETEEGRSVAVRRLTVAR